MSGCICPLAPDGRTAIDRPRNGPRSIAVHSAATDLNSRRLGCCVRLLSVAPTARRLANRGNASTQANEAPTAAPERLAYSIEEAAALLGVHYFSVYRLIQRGKLKPCRALRGKLLVPRTELVKLLKTE
jgi:excisionase family DNA binding protein